MEDMTHMVPLDAIGRELVDIATEYNRRVNGLTDKAELIAIRREQLDMVEDFLKKNRRTLKYLNGDPIEPIVHHGEAVLIGVGDQAG
jgi:hypothetical protein